jgi:SPP1 family predicted phage head-tail adaptor
MASGPLDRLLQFRRYAEVDDGFGMAQFWSDHGDPVWAAKADVSDGERWRGGEVAASITTRFLVRWSAFTADLTPKDRLTCDGRQYDIFGIKEGKGRHQWLEITAAARND